MKSQPLAVTHLFLCVSLLFLQVGIDSIGLPNFFCAVDKQLVDACGAAIACLGPEIEGTSNYMIVRDETAFSKTMSLVYGLDAQNPGQAMVVGGTWPDFAKVLPDEDAILTPEVLATVTCCTAVKRLDKRTDLFLVQMLPRNQKIDAACELRSLGEVVESCALSWFIWVSGALFDGSVYFGLKMSQGIPRPNFSCGCWRTDRIVEFFLVRY